MNNSKITQLSIERERQRVAQAQRLADEQTARAADILAQKALEDHKNKPASLPLGIDKDSYHTQTLPNGITVHTMNVDVRTIPSLVENWKDVNPREINEQENHVKLGILNTLRNEPEQMITRNQGLTFTAKHVSVDHDTSSVNIQLTDREIHGLLNGGHTTHWILAVADEMRKAGKFASWESYVRVTVYVGLKTKEAVAEVSDPLNTNVAVKRSQSAFQRGKYDVLVDSLKDTHFFDDIAFKGTGKILVADIMRILVAFDKYNYPRNTDHAMRVDLETSKKGKGSFTSVLDAQVAAEFLPKVDTAGNVIEHRNSMKILFTHAVELLELRDQIVYDLLTNHTKALQHVASGGKAPRTILSGNKKKLQFLKNDVTVTGQQWKGWYLPMLGAFRANVVWDSEAETIDWIVPNKTLIKAVMPEMIKTLIKRHKEKDSTPSNLLRDTDTYQALYDIAETKIAEIVAKGKKTA